MKKLLCIASLFVCCWIGNAQKKQAVTFQAEIANRNGDSIRILNSATGKPVKKIGINKQGIFKDSFAVEEGMYMLSDGKEYTKLFLKNGYNLKLKMDAQQFDESIVYTGIGASENNFLAQNAPFLIQNTITTRFWLQAKRTLINWLERKKQPIF